MNLCTPFAMMAIATAATVSSSFAADPPRATIILRAEGSPPLYLSDAGEWIDEAAGTARYGGVLDDAQGQWSFSWDYTVDLTGSDAEGSIVGHAQITNNELTDREYACVFRVAIHNGSPIETVVGGQAQVLFTTDEGGGTLKGGTTLDYLHTFKFDGNTAAALWSSQTMIELEGENSSELSQVFGWGFPENAIPGPLLQSTVGVYHNFTISGSDTARLVSTLLIQAPD